LAQAGAVDEFAEQFPRIFQLIEHGVDFRFGENDGWRREPSRAGVKPRWISSTWWTAFAR
jgi:hypothetical protein